MLKIILLILNCKKYDWKRKQQKEGLRHKDEEWLEKFEDRCRREGKELIFKQKQKLELERAKEKKEAVEEIGYLREEIAKQRAEHD